MLHVGTQSTLENWENEGGALEVRIRAAKERKALGMQGEHDDHDERPRGDVQPLPVPSTIARTCGA